ncbi:MAG: hypothetical protein AAGE93_12770 [Bacteroidota bacterium]
MGQMKNLIDQIIKEKALGDSFQELNIQMKLMLKGIPVKTIDETTPNDPEMLQLIYAAAHDFNVQLPQTIA